MHLIHRGTGEAARELAGSPPPLGPAFGPGVASQTETIEVWGTSFDDPGRDFCEFRAMDAAGREIGRMRLGGY